MKEKQRIYNSAVHYLSMREHSQRELGQKLHKKGFDSDLVQEVIEELTAANLQSEQRFTESFIRSRVNKGQGLNRISQELQQRGIHRETIIQALREEPVDWFELAYQTKVRRFGTALPHDAKERARQMRFLYTRGFNHEQINHALSEQEEA